MSKFKGKFSKKKDFDGERGSFDKDRHDSRKSSKDKGTKYRKKNFRDFGEGDSDEEGSKRSALKENTPPGKTDGDRPGTGRGQHRSDSSYSASGNFRASGDSSRRSSRSGDSRNSDFRSGDSRSGNSRKINSFSKDSSAGGRNSGGERNRFSRQEKPVARSRNRKSDSPAGGSPGGEIRKSEPPVYDSFSSLRSKESKVSAEERNIRLNKYIADAGVCSRREADKLIEAGEIKVNGQTITELGYKVGRKDAVTHNGQKLRAEKLVYVLLNKPKDFISTVEDPEDRKTVVQLVANACDERIYPVGRLDRNTTGLLLLTNDGELAKKLTHPSHNVKKIYQVDLDKPLEEEDFEKIKQGIVLEDGLAEVDEVAVLSEDKTILGLEIHLGRNRIVRRIFEHLGYEVIRLDRVMFAGLTKKDLPRGKWRYLSEKELIRLKHFK